MKNFRFIALCALLLCGTSAVQAGGSLNYSYRDSCYLMHLSPGSGPWFLGAGKVTVSANLSIFSGVVGIADGSNGNGGRTLLSALLGTSGPTNNSTLGTCGDYDINCVQTFAPNSMTVISRLLVYDVVPCLPVQ